MADLATKGLTFFIQISLVHPYIKPLIFCHLLIYKFAYIHVYVCICICTQVELRNLSLPVKKPLGAILVLHWQLSVPIIPAIIKVHM